MTGTDWHPFEVLAAGLGAPAQDQGLATLLLERRVPVELDGDGAPKCSPRSARGVRSLLAAAFGRMRPGPLAAPA